MHKRQHYCLVASTALVLAAALVGCDKKAESIAPPALMSITSQAQSPVPSTVAVRSIATLAAGQSTMLAPLPGGFIFVLQSQAGGAGGKILELRPGESTPRPTSLSAALVLQSLGTAKDGSGQFTAIAPCADGRLAFSFAGAAGGRPFAAVGTFMPETKQLFVSVDSISLANVDSDLATDVARPSLFTAGDTAWLWRTAGDEVRLLKADGLSQPRPKLSTQRISLESIKDVVARSTWEWSATATSGEFLLTDTASRWIRKVDALGTMAHLARFDETVTTISPASLDAAGRVVVLGNDREGVTTCALVQDGAAFKAIDRAKFDVAGHRCERAAAARPTLSGPREVERVRRVRRGKRSGAAREFEMIRSKR